MKKKTVWIITLVLSLIGAFVMGYGMDWVIDLIGAILLFGGGGFASYFVIKNRDGKKRWIVSLICIWGGIIIFTIAGFVRFKGAIIFALLGAVFVAAHLYIEYRRRQ